ncbi:MAG: orotidine 5'-phosphate decarboxylase / HUMPS family protein [bacterium]|nr:orotidine 5'-phosphate decarboxylase / HUMPS family protein [bacterium]
MNENKIWVALDVGVDRAFYLTKLLKPHARGFKIGPQLNTEILAWLITAKNPISAWFRLMKVRSLFAMFGGEFFWDWKIHDTPNTVLGASKALTKLQPRMRTVHASGGHEMLEAAVANRGESFVMAVTLLSSNTERDIHDIFCGSIRAKVLQFARLAVRTGCDGVISSPLELRYFQEYEQEFANLWKVTPSIRTKDSPSDDQERTMTAYEAILAGADELVIGRPIIDAIDPLAAIKMLNADVAIAQERLQKRAA